MAARKIQFMTVSNRTIKPYSFPNSSGVTDKDVIKVSIKVSGLFLCIKVSGLFLEIFAAALVMARVASFAFAILSLPDAGFESG